jgi:hypothetical protein
MEQSKLQQAFLPYNLIETRLKRATEENHVLSVGGLWSIPDIQKAVRDKQQVRDIVDTFHRINMLIKKNLTEDQRDKAHPMERVGFMWNKDFKGESYRPSRNILLRKNSPVTITKVSREDLPHPVVEDKKQGIREFEFVFDGLTVIMSKSGNRTRIVIEG